MKNHAITAAAVACGCLTFLGEIGFRFMVFVWTMANDAPTPAPVALEPAPPIVQPLAAATGPGAIEAPALATLPVVALRSLGRQRLGPTAHPGGRRIVQARRADLLEALGG